ncbi:RNAseH domain-containing protein, partial [Massilia atriviolacea]|uniref:RNAseH domain-containing protein n=1 Tax=Massilia atriviolacea TaxID=2495579 RepID=UPI001E563BBD
HYENCISFKSPLTNTPKIFAIGNSAVRGTWVPYHSGICATYAQPDLLTPVKTSEFIQRALAHPTDVLDGPLIVYLHSNLKRIYSGIKLQH